MTTWSIIGTGSNGTVTLSDDAVVSTPSVGAGLLLLVAHGVWIEDTNEVPPGFDPLTPPTDDAVLDGISSCYGPADDPCYSPAWLAWDIEGAGGQSRPDRLTGKHFSIHGSAAFRSVTSPVPAGTVVSYDFANDVSNAVVIQITGCDPFAGSTRQGNDDTYTIDTAFLSSGGLVAMFLHGDNAQPFDCSFFNGEGGIGPLTSTGASVTNVIDEEGVVASLRWDLVGGHCVSSPTDYSVNGGWYVGTFPAETSYDMDITENNATLGASAEGFALDAGSGAPCCGSVRGVRIAHTLQLG